MGLHLKSIGGLERTSERGNSRRHAERRGTGLADAYDRHRLIRLIQKIAPAKLGVFLTCCTVRPCVFNFCVQPSILHRQRFLETRRKRCAQQDGVPLCNVHSRAPCRLVFLMIIHAFYIIDVSSSGGLLVWADVDVQRFSEASDSVENIASGGM